MYSSPTLTMPSPFQSCPGRGTNSLIAIRGGGGNGVGVRVIVGGGVGVRVREGVRDAVGVIVKAQFARFGVPLIALPFASSPFRTTPVFVIQAVSLSAITPRRSRLPRVVEFPGHAPPLELAVSIKLPPGSNKRNISFELFNSPVKVRSAVISETVVSSVLSSRK